MAEENPVFDLDNMSWGDTERADIAQLELQQAKALGDPVKLAQAYESFRAVIASALVSLPDSWLVRGVPAVLADVPMAERLKYLKRGKMPALITAFTSVEDVAKN